MAENSRSSAHPYVPQVRSPGAMESRYEQDIALSLLLGLGGAAQGFFVLCWAAPP